MFPCENRKLAVILFLVTCCGLIFGLAQSHDPANHDASQITLDKALNLLTDAERKIEELALNISEITAELHQSSRERALLRKIQKRYNRIVDFMDRAHPAAQIRLDHKNMWKDPIPEDARKSRSRVALDNSVTTVWTVGYGVEISAQMCYAAKHGYPYYLEVLELQPDRFICQARFRTAQKILPFFDWVLMISSDVIIVNHSKKVEEFLDDRFDVILTRRDFYGHWNTFINDTRFGHYPQINTEMLAIRNTPFGRRFLDEMLLLSDADHGAGIVYDMGDIHEAVIKVIFPDKYEECAKFHIDWRMKGPGSAAIPEGQHPLDVWTQSIRASPCKEIFTQSEFPHVKILRMGVMFRDIGGRADKLMQCTDFAVHTKDGPKMITPEEVYCMDIPGGIPYPDQFMTYEESVAFAKELGYEYDGCKHRN